MSGLPPVTGRINITLQVVEGGKLPDPPIPLPPSPPTDPVVQARMQEMALKHKGTNLVFVSATVYDHRRTLVRIYPNGGIENEVAAWSNLDFNVFSGWGDYRIANSDGTIEDCSLLMGIGDAQTDAMQRIAAKNLQDYESPEIPALPDLATSGPAFLVVTGDEDSPTMDTLEQIHDLFRKEGQRLVEAQIERKLVEVARKAEFLAPPPKPADVKIRYWKGELNATKKEVTK